MLAPDQRALLLDGLRPPSGYRLDHAVGTTFTLDLETALTVPLAFAGFDLSNAKDPVAVLEAIRSTADRVDVFCQAGAIKAGHWPSDLVVLLEGVIHDVVLQRHHLFHPKVWILRYAPQDEGDDVDVYRVLVLSRNLTGDRSWDVILRLDGEHDRKINQGNAGLHRFVQALPGLAKYDLPKTRFEAIERLADEVRKVHWELPAGVAGVEFWPFGIPGMRQPATRELFAGYRHLLVAPFISEDGLESILTDATGEVQLVARQEQLDRLPAGTLDDVDVYVIDAAAGLDDPDAVEDEDSTGGTAGRDLDASGPGVDDDASQPSSEAQALFGALHAKFYVVESNRRARVFVGSANMTHQAFNGNVEMLCELVGGATKIGIDTFLGDSKGLASILVPYASPDSPVTDEEEDLCYRLDQVLTEIASIQFAMTVQPDGQLWSAVVRSGVPLKFDGSVSLSIGPFNRHEQTAVVSGARAEVPITAREGADLTPFFRVTASTLWNEKTLERSAVLRAEMIGGPEDRVGEVIVRQIDTPEKFLRLLLLILGLGDGAWPAAATAGADSSGGGVWTTGGGGLFELLVRALARQPDSLDDLASIVERLRSHGKAAEILPPDWDLVWAAVESARHMVGVAR